MSADASEELARTPLYDLHVALGAKMAPFAGYAMPIHYPAGILSEHVHTRAQAGLFDVSHMGQIHLSGVDAVAALESLCPADLRELKPGRQKYGFFTDAQAGILDDLMISHAGDRFVLVVNAANAKADLAHLERGIGRLCRIEFLADRALLALQGPKAAAVLARLAPESGEMRFMSAKALTLAGIPAFVTRSGYTGEDGFEISVPAESAEGLARRLLKESEVKPVGLGARDSLRLEAGLCLHGQDISPDTNPVEADIAWAIGKRRRQEGGYPGHAVVQRALETGTARKRVGLLPEGRAPARAHSEIVDAEGRVVGEVTSGGFGPSAKCPIAMGYVQSRLAEPGTPLGLMVRGKALPAKVVALPFVPHRYYRG